MNDGTLPHGANTLPSAGAAPRNLSIPSARSKRCSLMTVAPASFHEAVDATMIDSVSKSTTAPGPNVVITWLGRTSPIDGPLMVSCPRQVTVYGDRTLRGAQPREVRSELPKGLYCLVEC